VTVRMHPHIDLRIRLCFLWRGLTLRRCRGQPTDPPAHSRGRYASAGVLRLRVARDRALTCTITTTLVRLGLKEFGSRKPASARYSQLPNNRAFACWFFGDLLHAGSHHQAVLSVPHLLPFSSVFCTLGSHSCLLVLHEWVYLTGLMLLLPLLCRVPRCLMWYCHDTKKSTRRSAVSVFCCFWLFLPRALRLGIASRPTKQNSVSAARWAGICRLASRLRQHAHSLWGTVAWLQLLSKLPPEQP